MKLNLLRFLLLGAMLSVATQAARGELPELDAANGIKVFCNNIGIFPGHVAAVYPEKIKAKKKKIISDEIERATAFAEKLIGFEGDPDVVLLQEIWSINARDQLIKQLAEKYPHVAHPDGLVPPPAMMMPSGLMIFSKHPLTGFAYHRFTVGVGGDKLARKGIIGAWLNMKESKVAIFTTHLQAGNKKKHPRIRPDQMGECNEFIREFVGDEKEATVILGGDFNTHSTDPNAYGAIFEQLPGFRDSFQSGLTELTQTGRNPKHPNKRIDYLLTLNAESAVSTIVDPTGPTISDHLSLLGAIGLD